MISKIILVILACMLFYILNLSTNCIWSYDSLQTCIVLLGSDITDYMAAKKIGDYLAYYISLMILLLATMTGTLLAADRRDPYVPKSKRSIIWQHVKHKISPNTRHNTGRARMKPKGQVKLQQPKQ